MRTKTRHVVCVVCIRTQGAFVNGETIVVDGGGVAAGKDGFPESKL